MSEETKDATLEVVQDEDVKDIQDVDFEVEPEQEKQKEAAEPAGESDQEDLQLSPEELAILKRQRAADKRRKECSMAIQEILQKYNATVVVDPQSPFGRPAIVVQLL